MKIGNLPFRGVGREQLIHYINAFGSLLAFVLTDESSLISQRDSTSFRAMQLMVMILKVEGITDFEIAELTRAGKCFNDGVSSAGDSILPYGGSR